MTNDHEKYCPQCRQWYEGFECPCIDEDDYGDFLYHQRKDEELADERESD